MVDIKDATFERPCIEKKMDLFCANLTWLLRGNNHPNLKIYAVNPTGPHTVDIVLLDHGYTPISVSYKSLPDLMACIVDVIADKVTDKTSK